MGTNSFDFERTLIWLWVYSRHFEEISASLHIILSIRRNHLPSPLLYFNQSLILSKELIYIEEWVSCKVYVRYGE